MGKLKKISSGLVTASIAFGLMFSAPVHSVDSLEPRQVAKAGAVEVPQGMHLVVDRAGLRWLLPEGMDVPPEREVQIKYFKTRELPRAIGRIGSQEILSGPVSAQDTVLSRDLSERTNLMTKLPPAFAELMRLEKEANLHAQMSADLRSLGDFAPNAFTTFKLPFIPIPEADMQFAHVSDYATTETKDLIRFKKNGQKFVRFFIHPNYVNAYADLIERFGIVYHYEAITTSSPRSLIAIDPDRPAEVHWIKVSIHKEIDGSVRINTDKKARRAIIMSEAIQNVPAERLAEYKLQFMLEPASLQPPGKISSTIHREVAQELLFPKPNTKWIPAFILQNTGAEAVPGFNIKEMAALAGETPTAFVKDRIIRPLLRSYLSMGLIEGLPGELHTQNFYYKMKMAGGGWLPTGEVMFKDNDGFRFDTELALRQGRKLDTFAKFDEPFVWGKYSNAIGTGAEGVAFLGSWYYKLIRNVSGFETLAAYLLRAINQLEPQSTLDKNGIQKLFDNIAAEEATKITGIPLSEADYGFGQDKGLNKVLGEWRTKLALSSDNLRQKNDANLQVLLKREWARLREAGRVSALRRSVSSSAYFILHNVVDGALMIEARTAKPTASNPDPVIGFAMVESPSTPEGALAHRRLSEFARSAVPRAAPRAETRVGVGAGAVRCETLFMAEGA